MNENILDIERVMRTTQQQICFDLIFEIVTNFPGKHDFRRDDCRS